MLSSSKRKPQLRLSKGTLVFFYTVITLINFADLTIPSITGSALSVVTFVSAWPTRLGLARPLHTLTHALLEGFYLFELYWS